MERFHYLIFGEDIGLFPPALNFGRDALIAYTIASCIHHKKINRGKFRG
jgi:hypothetical protein